MARCGWAPPRRVASASDAAGTGRAAPHRALWAWQGAGHLAYEDRVFRLSKWGGGRHDHGGAGRCGCLTRCAQERAQEAPARGLGARRARGALVDAGASLDALRSELRKLPLEGWELVGREVRKGAFRATKVDVEIDPHAHPHHRALGDVLALLEQSGLGTAVREKAARVFTRLADAEARAHGTTRDRVRFHDVGAVDAIVDVTGACVGLELLGVQAVHVSALPLGGGVVDGPHGKMPVPAPGTAELLRGFPVVDTGVKVELVTPTGAAILTTLALSAGRMPAMTVAAVGYGAGTRDLPGIPTCCAASLARRWTPPPATRPSSRSRRRSTTCRHSSTSRSSSVSSRRARSTCSSNRSS